MSQEIYKHYELYKHLQLNTNALNQTQQPEKKLIQTNFESILNAYCAHDNHTKVPLVICSFKEDSLPFSYLNECTTDELVSKWIFNSVKQNQQNKAPHLRSLVFRFCGHTILASDIFTLIQSIVHQICYLFEVHESWSFNVSQSTTILITFIFHFHQFSNY